MYKVINKKNVLFFQAYNSTDFVPALELAKENGLKLALHIAEASMNQ